MKEPGIPIPHRPNGRLCGGCGIVGSHATDCPSLRIGRINIPQATEETKALREEIADLRLRIAALEAAAPWVAGGQD